ncbi:MAG TPA: DNA translocase FtsK, partial [Ktedonobacteraceae bacterium]|nr:DNA translocase FtsK [Ktedonobacteraceae bacterium]
NPTGPSQFRGQRPRYSRYASAIAPNSADSMDDMDSTNGTPASHLPQPGRQVNTNIHLEEEEDEGEEYVDFESDFDADDAFDDEDDDPLNDINIHKQHISRIPRGPRQPQPIDLSEHKSAVQGARQQPLPFNAAQAQAQQKSNGGKAPQEMEPLAPNPWLNNKAIITPRIPLAESPWNIPDTSMLNRPEEVKLQILGDDTSTLAKTIQDTLRSFKVDAEVKQEDISIGPTVIRFGIRPTGKPEMKVDEKSGKFVPVRDAGGNIVYETRTRVSRIMALQNDLALVLEAKAIRMEAPVPGRPYVGVEIPNKNSRLVTLREVLESKEYIAAKAKSKLAVALGKDVAGQVRVGDLARMPHLLIAGATGAGKCLAYDEPIFLADGRVMNVQDLVGQSVQVIGVTDTQTMQQTPVPATFTENGVQEVFEIELDNGIILRRTGEHPLWAACLDENQHVGRQPNGKASRRTRAIDAGWVHSKDLRVCGTRPDFDGHVVLTPLALQQKGTISHSDADVILCSALLAEGALNHYAYLNYNRTPRFTSADFPMVELVATAAKEYDCKLMPSSTKGKATDYYISRNSFKRWEGNPISKLIHDWKINCLATQKTIPPWVFQLPDEQIALFLRVFIDCDGWICARTKGTVSVNVSLANPTLVRQLGQLAMRLGITGTYTYKDNGFAGAWSWYSPMVDFWAEKVGSLVKAEKLSRAVDEQTKNREFAATEWTAWRRARPTAEQKFADCPEGYEWRKIVFIRRITAPTVNIEVHSDNHAFVGYAVEHNSVCINTIIASMLTQASPEDVRLLMVDPKMVELNMYGGIPHLLSPVVTEVEKVVPLLRNGITEMERRYRLFSQLGVRNLDGYRKMRTEKIAHNDYSLKNLPAIVIIIDELADLMMAAPEEVEGMICRLAQLARATGIHLVIATQRPSVDVITGLIKANIPTRISFMVSSAVDSRTIIDMGGAERLLGRGDMLYLPADAGRPERIQCCFLADEEAEQLVAYWRQQ